MFIRQEPRPTVWKLEELWIKLNYYLLLGDFECLKSAIQNGADSIYLGASSFSARSKAKNFNLIELREAIKYAKLRNVKIHLALNTLIKNNEFENAVKLAIDAYNLGVDAIIIQDIGLFSYLLNNYPEIPLHASTQMTVHNLDGVKQLETLGFKRVVLSRELSIDEIKYIRENTSIELEVFIHGALCISYSGECLLSSMIGNRSGNRGSCAQPCRLKYDLIEKNEKKPQSFKTIDSGYLMSPKDNMGLYYLPELIKHGINSLKIEGRMKTPIYVGTVTKIYRKYIDLVYENINLDNERIKNIIRKELYTKNEDTNLSDFEELLQVFNRGGFESGHFDPDGNKNLIYKEKPNNIGIPIGKVLNINPNKGYITTNLKNSVSILDKIMIKNSLYNISELMVNNKNTKESSPGTTITIGRMKGNINLGDIIYKIESNKLNKIISESFNDNSNNKKIKIKGEINIKKDIPISFKVWADNKFYKGLEYIVTSANSPEQAINSPITKEQIEKQIYKTGNTQFEFDGLIINLENNLFIQYSILNELKRTALLGLENLVIKANTHNLFYKKINPPKLNTNLSSYNKKILLLNCIDTYFDYSTLKNVDNLYIPLKYYLNSKYNDILIKISKEFKTYIYLPIIIKDCQLKALKFDKILKQFSINGFVVSHISQISIISKFGLEIIGNYSLNVFNNYSIEFLQSLGLNSTTLSPELTDYEFENFKNQDIIIYGKIPVMTNQYCYLGKSNKCYSTCSKKCLNNKKYYLKDRMNCNYRIIPDNYSTITTIYNYKPINIEPKSIKSNNYRIDILDENLNQIKKVLLSI